MPLGMQVVNAVCVPKRAADSASNCARLSCAGGGKSRATWVP
jgi:hypothetical protein